MLLLLSQAKKSIKLPRSLLSENLAVLPVVPQKRKWVSKLRTPLKFTTKMSKFPSKMCWEALETDLRYFYFSPLVVSVPSQLNYVS